MEEKYYIQRIARKELNKIVEVPDGFEVSDKLLTEIDRSKFISAVKALHEVFKNIYKDVIIRPELYGIVCYEIGSDEKKLKNTANYFSKMVRMLTMMFQEVSETKDSLSIDVEKMKSFKCRKLEYVLERLSEQGFVFEGLENGYDLKNINTIKIFYPSNPNVFRVLKVCGGLSCLDYTTLSDNKKLKEQSIDFIYNSLTSDFSKKMLDILHEKFLNNNFQYKIKHKIRYGLKNKKEFLFFIVNKSGGVDLKIRLNHLEKYQHLIDECSEKVKNSIIKSKDCTHCNYCGVCTTQIVIKYQDTTYTKCNPHWWWVNFVFNDVDENDFDSIMKLVNAELPYYVSDNKA